MPYAPAKQPRESRGNRCLLVLADSAQTEYLQLPEALFAALDHFGMPYRVLDVARKRPAALAAADVAAIVVAQEHLGHSLTQGDKVELLRAVDAGVGLINFDHDIEGYGDEFSTALGLIESPHAGSVTADGSDALTVCDNDHFISYTQDSGMEHRFRMPVPVTVAKPQRADLRVLAVSPQGAPVLASTSVGSGRVVQWFASPKLWLAQYLGHAHGLDDLFWKAIVWAARKPFVMKAMPPFVRLRFDDCNGLWRTAADLRFVDVLTAAGHTPSLCVCMRAVLPDGAHKLHELHEERLAEIAPHTLEGGTGIFYGDAHREYSVEEFRAIMREVDEHLSRWQVVPSKILSDHDHEYSSRVLPFLKERGICFKMNITLPDERWGDVHRDWRPAPYGSMSYAFDYLPGRRDLFAVFNHHPAFDYARAYLPDGRFLYNRAGGFGPHMWDFLNGLTTYRGRRRSNDIKAAAERLAVHTRLGLDSLFFGGSITHSHFIQTLAPQEWETLLIEYERLTQRHEKRNVGYDAIAHYARAKVDTHLAEVQVDDAEGRVRCVLDGWADVPLELYVFRNAGEGIEHTFELVPPFQSRTEVAFASR